MATTIALSRIKPIATVAGAEATPRLRRRIHRDHDDLPDRSVAIQKTAAKPTTDPRTTDAQTRWSAEIITSSTARA